MNGSRSRMGQCQGEFTVENRSRTYQGQVIREQARVKNISMLRTGHSQEQVKNVLTLRTGQSRIGQNQERVDVKDRSTTGNLVIEPTSPTYKLPVTQITCNLVIEPTYIPINYLWLTNKSSVTYLLCIYLWLTCRVLAMLKTSLLIGLYR